MKDLTPSQKETRRSVRPGPEGVSVAPPVYGIDFLDREKLPDSSPTETDDGILDDSYQEYRGAPFRLGHETHQIVIKLVGEKIVAGIESDFRTLQQIKKTLLDLAGQAGHELEDEEDDIKELFEDAEAAEEELSAKWFALTKATKNLRDFGRLGPKAPQSDKDEYDDLKERKSNARRAHTEAEYALDREIALAVEAAWENYSDFLGPNLMPVGAVFRERDFKGDTSKHTYYTGADAAHAIPIVWYKAPDDYPPIVTADGKTHTLAGTAAGSVKIGKKKLGVDDANQPDSKAFKLRKVAHEGDRTGQKEFNNALNDNNAGVLENGKVIKKALGPGGYDGDHVKDLGFNGEDAEDNYWPLLARINRRAFNGYNSGYIVNYINEKGQHKAKSIGGLIGKYFKVKDFIPDTGGAIPDESGTRYAGTINIKP